MIEFKIITCPDKSQQATYQHLGTELTIGKVEGDMVVDDPAFASLQLRIRLAGEKAATLENLDETVEVRLNGKAISGVVPLKEKDNLTVARTTINFSRLDSALPQAPEPHEHANARERFAPGSREQALLDALKFLESSIVEAAPATPPPLPGAKSSPPNPPGMAKPPPLPGGMPPPLPRKN